MFKNINKQRTVLLLVSLSLALLISVGVTLAFVIAQTPPVENTFEPSVVDCAVVDGKDIKNTGDTEAYIRAAIIVTWKKDGVVWAQKPEINTDYTLAIDGNWKLIDGYYYYKAPVAAGDQKPLITGYTTSGTPPQEGYQICIEVVAAAVQSQPDQAVLDAWGVTVADIKS